MFLWPFIDIHTLESIFRFTRPKLKRFDQNKAPVCTRAYGAHSGGILLSTALRVSMHAPTLYKREAATFLLVARACYAVGTR